MADVSTVKSSVLTIVNKARERLGLSQVTALTQDSGSKTAINYLNQVLSIVSDKASWKDTYRETFVTASTSVFNYKLDVNTPVKNIEEIVFGADIAPLRLVNAETIRRLVRTSSVGEPSQYAIMLASGATQTFRVYPTPGVAENNKTFFVAYYEKPAILTTSDDNIILPYPEDLLVQGLYAFLLKDESKGGSSAGHKEEMQLFRDTLIETDNRSSSDTGTDPQFRPAFRRHRR